MGKRSGWEVEGSFLPIYSGGSFKGVVKVNTLRTDGDGFCLNIFFCEGYWLFTL